MRRAVIRAFRTARRHPSRKFVPNSAHGSVLLSSNYVLGLRTFSSSNPLKRQVAPATSSMHIRRFSVALASILVAYGAWYTYRSPTDGDVADDPGLVARQSRSSTPSIHSYTSQSVTSGEVATEPTRKAVVVTADSIYTGSIEGDEPISKFTDDSGRKVLEMLTPDQATQKLRRNEESCFVGRGKGVVRYDVVQIPSNEPIEDDHSEKIVEVPQPLVTATGEVNSSSDWMFWGVYDGHRHASL
jgi:pyruvate dehydrogenase phosphatase